MLRLSFIVPFYNTEPYIEECIRSLYNQDIPQSEYEVICVDDCSPDGSRVIVERLQKEYPTLKLLLHSENKRQGGARNTGFNVAQGRYIWFVDSDDYIMPNVLNDLLQTAESNDLHVLQFDYNRSAERLGNEHIAEQVIQNGEAYLFADKSRQWDKRVVGPWRQLIRRQLLGEQQIAFVEGCQYEDTDYMLRVFLTAQRVQYIKLMAYYYRRNEQSTTLDVPSPQKIAWQINQLVRCSQLIDICKTSEGKDCLTEMVRNSFSALRVEIKILNAYDKCIYLQNLTADIAKSKKYMNWRTWFALRYGITAFVK